MACESRIFSKGGGFSIPSVTKDTIPPDTTITDIPDYVNSLTSITSTASDAGSGVNKTGYADWSYDLSAVPWQDGCTYEIYAKAIDRANNVDGTPASDSFGFDTTPHQISKIPANPPVQAQGGEVNITCSVADNAGVSKVKVIITGPEGFESIDTAMRRLAENNYCYNFRYSIPGTYTFYIWASDTTGNENISPPV